MWLKLTRRYDTSDPEVWTTVFIKNLSLNFPVEVWFEGDKESMHCQEMVTGSSKTNSFLLLLLFSRSVVFDSTTPWTAACQASLSITISQSLLKLTSVVLVMPSNHLVLCYLLLLLPSIFTSTRVFSNELALCIRWSKDWSFSFSISPSNEYSGLISFRIDWFDLLEVQGTLKSLLPYSSKTWILQGSAFFMV